MKTILFWFLLYNPNVDTAKQWTDFIPINEEPRHRIVLLEDKCDYCMKTPYIPYAPFQPINKE